MKGLQLHVTLLAGRDTKRFEDEMIYWTQEVQQYYQNSVRIFDKSNIFVGETTRVEGENYIYCVKLPRLSIEYLCITGNMCILLKVTRTDGENYEILYEIHDTWEGTHLWYSPR